MSVAASFSNAEEMNGNEMARSTVGKYSCMLLARYYTLWKCSAYEIEFEWAFIHLTNEQFDDKNKRNQSPKPGDCNECEWDL